MYRHSSRLTPSPPIMCPTLGPANHHFSLSLHQLCALRYVPSFITSHFLYTKILPSVRTRYLSRLTVSPPTLCSSLCANILYVSLSLQQHSALCYAPKFIMSHCPYKKSVLRCVPPFITSYCPSNNSVISVISRHSLRPAALSPIL